VGRQAVKIVADTNVIVRAITADEPQQTAIAQAQLREAEVVAISASCLCEVVWVLSRIYKISMQDIAVAIRGLLGAATVKADAVVVESGLAFLDGGGDFADGVIALEGQKLGGETFVSFDKRAVKLLQAAGQDAREL
jgi:predicted nucleic-acid-binding protein